MLQGVVFDLDGTLVGSEGVWMEVTKRIVESFGKEFDPAWHKEIRGTGSMDAMRRVKERFDLPVSVEELDRMNMAFFHEALQIMLPTKRAGADELLAALTQAGIPFALATGASRALTERILRGHNWLNTFAAVVTVDDVAFAKPAPDTFDQAARRMACDPAFCVAFEDGPNGVASAKAAGMKVIGIADNNVGALVGTVRLIRTFDEVTIEDLREIASA